ncbi:tubulin glycylase 3A-like [Schistocerca gregaria]|uniref:tubulin glycylase 3A-like n=1 Tax=Schistocerca gregaria TaxID=7010 RepID=UPI00211EB128|nr:tubulin glycylase 3A-like [Schistocerca gregaria]
MDPFGITNDKISVESEPCTDTENHVVTDNWTATSNAFLTSEDIELFNNESDNEPEPEAAPKSDTDSNTHSTSQPSDGAKGRIGSGNRKRSQGKNRYSRAYRIVVSYEKLRELKQKVDQAIKDHKVFTVMGSFPSVREALKQRGWVEKLTPNHYCYRKSGSLSAQDDADINEAIQDSLMNHTAIRACENEAMLMTRLLRNTSVDFIWSMRYDPLEYQDVNKKQFINRLPRPSFTSKVGLCSFLQQMQWFCEDGVSETLFPRCYNICQAEEKTAFKNDFRLTACVNLLKWLVTKYESDPQAVQSPDGKIPHSAVHFAIKRCWEYISARSHEDIDKDEPITIWDHQWDQYLTWYYLLMDETTLLCNDKETPLKTLYATAKTMLIKIRKFWPQIDLDGMNNIWILKPGNKCRGRGIQLVNRLESVLHKINPAVMKESRYVVQKYIERPLLIYKTKFDIRQWFLVTSTHPLVVWMYKESYLRFCSQPFSLKNFHESVHLCNNAVQARYKNGKRDPALPDENMWDCYTFQAYLRTIGHADRWEKCIYPGMRASIIGTLLASQDHMDKRRNSFELFGADFMVTEDFCPWLIEINSCPCMAPTTSVTARMCSQCLEDVIKVVVDRRQDKRADTGMFECIYKQRVSPAPPYLGMTLAVRGNKCNLKGIKPSLSIRTRKLETGTTINSDKRSETKKMCVENHSSFTTERAKINETKPKIPTDILGPVVIDFIEDLAKQLSKETNSMDAEDVTDTQKLTNDMNCAGEAETEEVTNWKDELFPNNTLRRSNKFNTKKINSQKKAKINDGGKEKLQEHVTGDAKRINLNATAFNCDTTSTDSGISEDHSSKNKKLKHNGSDSIKSMELFGGWRKKLDETKSNCQSILDSLKTSGDSGSLSNITSFDKNIRWAAELSIQTTVREFVKQLTQSISDKNPTQKHKLLADPFSPLGRGLGKLKLSDDSRVRQCYLNILLNNGQLSKFKRSHEIFNPQYLDHKFPMLRELSNDTPEKNAMHNFKGVLPNIKHRKKFSTNDDGNEAQKRQNLCALGMSLKTIRSGLGHQEHLLMPLGLKKYTSQNESFHKALLAK